MGQWRLLGAVGVCWVAALLGCGSDNPGGGLIDSEGGVIVGDDGGTTPVTICRNSKDCPLDQVCDPTAKACVQCVSNSDCEMGLLCQGSHCVVPTAACMNSLDCKADPNNPICDTSTGKCVLCVTSTDCPMNNDCIDHA